MKRLLLLGPLALLSLVALMGAVSLNTSYFDSISVTSTNFMGEGVVTNGLTLGGVRNTTWPSGGSTNLTDSGTNVLAKGAVKMDNLVATNGVSLGAYGDVNLLRDATNTIALRNGTNAQALRVYNTYANGGTDFERLNISFSGNQAYVFSSAGGTGTARPLNIGVYAVGGAINLYGGPTGGPTWIMDGTGGHFLAYADATYDIGASGANRPRNVYITGALVTESSSGSVTAGKDVYAGRYNTAGTLGHWTRGFITFNGDGVWEFSNNAVTDFDRLQFGGTTTNFPSLKRSTTGIVARLADDSADTWVGVSAVKFGTNVLSATGTNLMWNGGTVSVTY